MKYFVSPLIVTKTEIPSDGKIKGNLNFTKLIYFVAPLKRLR